MSKNSYSHILKYTGLFGGIQLLNILIALVRNKFVAIILGPQGMGLLSLFNSTISFVANSTNLGIAVSAVKNISTAYEKGEQRVVESEISVVRTWSLLTAVFGMLLCIAVSPLLNSLTFSWGDHTLHFVCLSPIVGLMAITGGETAILKGLRQLGKLARISVYNIIGALVTSVPLYYVFRDAAIVPSLIIIAVVQMVLTVGVSYRLYPPKLSFSQSNIRKGTSMVRLGIAFVIAGIFGSGADLAIRSYLNNVATLDVVGIFNAGYMITMVYAGMVFTSMETDYFPRLSAINGNTEQLNDTVNKQIEVSLLMISPLLVALMIGIPIIVPLLYSSKFLPAQSMIQVALLSMYLRAVILPMAYIALSTGCSRGYLVLEGISALSIVVFTIVGFDRFGLIGTGAAMVLTYTIDIIATYVYAHKKFRYRISGSAVKYFFVQFSIGIATLALVFLAKSTVAYWVIGALLVAASLGFSIQVLRSSRVR